MKNKSQSWTTRQLCECALFAAILAVSAQIQIALPLVPINAALFTVHLCAVLLCKKQGILSILTYLILGLVGLPVFSGFSGGVSVLFGPTGGYLVGYLASSWVTSLVTEKLEASYKNTLIAMTLGTIACYSLGTIWFMIITNMTLWATLGYCVFPFLIGDGVKVLAAATLAKRLLPFMKK